MKLNKEEKMLAELGDKFFKKIDNYIKALEALKEYRKEFIKYNNKYDFTSHSFKDKKHLKKITKMERKYHKRLIELENEKKLKSKNDKKIKL